MRTRWTICAAGALFLAPLLLPSDMPFGSATTVLAQGGFDPQPSVHRHRGAAHPVTQDSAKPVASVHRAKKAGTPSAASSGPPQPPPRVTFTAAEDAVAIIPGMPDARFLGKLHDRLYQRTSGTARPLARPLQRRRGRCFWCWPARRLERCGKSSPIFSRHRRQHRGTDGPLYLCRAAL